MRTRRTLINTCLLSALAVSGNAYSSSNVNEKLFDLHKRLQKVEAAEKETASNVHLHGLVEVEYGYNEDYFKVDSSDIVLATVELGIDATINDNVDIFVGLLYEEDDTPLGVEVGVINLHDERSPLSVSLGQMFVPFGAFDSHMISDPLTLELGETLESTVLVNFESNGATAGFYVFNPVLGEGADEDKATAFGLSLAYANDTSGPSWDPDADLNQDGVIDFKDLAILRQNFGLTFP